MCSLKHFIISTDKINGGRGWLALNPNQNIDKPYILQNVRIIFCKVISSTFPCPARKEEEQEFIANNKKMIWMGSPSLHPRQFTNLNFGESAIFTYLH